MQSLSISNPIIPHAASSLEKMELRSQRRLNTLVKMNLNKYLKSAGEEPAKKVIIYGMHIRIE